MKKRMLMMIAAAGLLLACPAAQAADYSAMSTAELAAMRGTMQDAPEEERLAFQEEWQRRVRMMTTSERRQYLGPPAETPAGVRPRFEGQERRPEEVPPAYGRDLENGRPRGLERGRERLLAPPASVAPRRYGERDDRQEQRQQTGPRRFAPTPDFDGGGSPLDLGRGPGGRGGARGRGR